MLHIQSKVTMAQSTAICLQPHRRIFPVPGPPWNTTPRPRRSYHVRRGASSMLQMPLALGQSPHILDLMRNSCGTAKHGKTMHAACIILLVQNSLAKLRKVHLQLQLQCTCSAACGLSRCRDVARGAIVPGRAVRLYQALSDNSSRVNHGKARRCSLCPTSSQHRAIYADFCIGVYRVPQKVIRCLRPTKKRPC